MMPSRRIFTWLVTTLVAASLLSCQPKTKTTNSRLGGASSYRYLKEDSVKVVREEDKTKAILSFETNTDAFCRLLLFSQDEGESPDLSRTRSIDCSNTDAEPRASFSEKIDALKEDQLYYVRLYVWPEDANENLGDTALVKEGKSSGTDGGLNGPGKFSELFVVRLDLPLKEAEVHRHQLPSPEVPATFKTALHLKEGCRQGSVDLEEPYRLSEGEIKLTRLDTTGFAVGSATPHPDYPQRRRLAFVDFSSKAPLWNLSYLLNDGENNASTASVDARLFGQIQSLEMKSTESLAFPTPKLDEVSDLLKIDATKPLSFSWTTTKLADDAQVIIQIARPERTDAISCVYPAKAQKGDVDATLLQTLATGKHVVLVELSSNQLSSVGGWLVNTVDWRSSRIEK